MVDDFNGRHIKCLSWLITLGIFFNGFPSHSRRSCSCYAKLLSDIMSRVSGYQNIISSEKKKELMCICSHTLSRTHFLWFHPRFSFLVCTTTYTQTQTHLKKLLDCRAWPHARCQVPGKGALWLLRLFNGLLDSPFLLNVENNTGECSKLITFGPALAATF